MIGLAAGGAVGATALGLRDPVDWLLGALVLATVEATVVTIAVGAVLDAYSRWALLAGVAVVTIVLAIAGRGRLAPWPGARGLYRSGNRILRQLAWWQIVIVVVAVIALMWRVLLAVVLPPFSYDALVYHLTAVADWVQTGRVDVNPYASCCSHYPSGAEVLFAWPAVFLRDDLLVDAVQIVLAVMAATAVVGLARRFGLGGAAALTAGALFLFTPIVLTQSNTPYNDVAVAAFLLSAAYFVVRLLEARCFVLGQSDSVAPSWAYAVVAGAATGLVLGAKTNGIVISAVLTLLVGAHVATAFVRRPELRSRLVGTAAIFVGATLVVGGWWYGRNWVETGNPVWPFEVTAGGIHIFDGTATVDEYLTVPPSADPNWLVQIARSWFDDLTFWTQSDYSYEERRGGLGPIWSWLGWAAVWLGLDALRRRPAVVVNLLLPLLAIFFLLPYKWWSRFTIFLPAVGAIAVIALVERLRMGRRRTALVLAVMVLGLAGVARASWTLDPAGFGSKLSPPDVLELAAHPRRERTVALFFPEYAFLPLLPDTASVAIDDSAPSIRFLYPFFGSGLDRTVTPLYKDDERRVGAVLAKADPDFVAVEAHGVFDDWLVVHPRYVRVFDEQGVRLYRARRSSS